MILSVKSRAAAMLPVIFVTAAAASAQCASGTVAALQFDGADDLAIVQNVPSGVLDGFLDFTVEAWFKSAPLTTDATVVSKSGSVSSVLSYAIRLSSAGQLQFYMGYPQIVVGGSNLDDDAWHHVAVTRTQGGVFTLYVDGAMTGTTVNTTAMPAAAAPFGIGAQINSGTPLGFLRMHGSIDEVRVFNVGRSQSQINATRFTTLQGNEQGLVGYWRLDDGAGQSFVNSAAATTGSLAGTLGANTFVFQDDPTWSYASTAPLTQCAPGAGQANSATATLHVNGVGDPGVNGPFLVTIPTSGPAAYRVTLTWEGSPNAPLVLITGSLLPAVAFVPCVGSLDLSPVGLTIVGDYYLTPPPLNQMFVLNENGFAETTFMVPSAILGSPWVSIQGLVFTGGCGVVPYKFTAAFTLQ